jgi:glyoxylase I family protein
MFAKTRIGAVVYYVADIDRTEAFYRDTLGLEVARMPGDPADETGGGDWLMANTSGDVSLIFFNMPMKPGASPVIVFELAEGGIDGAVEHLAKKGATIVTPVSHAPDGGWTADFADPDGHTLSMYQSADKPR